MSGDNWREGPDGALIVDDVWDAVGELHAELERLRGLLAALPDRIKTKCEAQARQYRHPEEQDYRAGIRWGGQVGSNVAKDATDE